MELTEDQLKIAENELKKFLPRSQQVYGFLVLRNRVRSDPYIVLVDRWPNFSVIICKAQHQQKSDFFKDTLVFANDDVILKEAIRNSSLIDWSRYLCLGTSLSLMEVFKAAASEQNIRWKQLSLCHMMILDDVSKLPSIDSSGLSVDSLNKSHLDLVNQTWKFGQNPGAAGMIRNMIANFPSCCMLDAEGKPVSWILTYASCSMGMLSEYRGKNYAKILISCLAKKLHAQGYPVFCFIEEDNTVSYQLFKNMGFTEVPSYRETWAAFNDF